ncbi:hypothetical protein O181_132800, partial [Austropuccinia psidii MF-1]|nr:hypothetical protein [Austropuccinia psidii MF-1]
QDLGGLKSPSIPTDGKRTGIKPNPIDMNMKIISLNQRQASLGAAITTYHGMITIALVQKQRDKQRNTPEKDLKFLVAFWTGSFDKFIHPPLSLQSSFENSFGLKISTSSSLILRLVNERENQDGFSSYRSCRRYRKGYPCIPNFIGSIFMFLFFRCCYTFLALPLQDFTSSLSS